MSGCTAIRTTEFAHSFSGWLSEGRAYDLSCQTRPLSWPPLRRSDVRARLLPAATSGQTALRRLPPAQGPLPVSRRRQGRPGPHALLPVFPRGSEPPSPVRSLPPAAGTREPEAAGLCVMPGSSDWFRAFMDTAPEVYFRYTLAPSRKFTYVSPSIQTLTGHAPDAFLAEPAFCLTLAPREDRRVLRQIARARRPLTTTLHLRHRDGTLVALDLRTVPVVVAGRGGKVVAVEGVASPVRVQPALDFAEPADGVGQAFRPAIQQRLAALLCEVHSLLHGTVESHRSASLQASEKDQAPLQIGDIAIDVDRMTVSLAGSPVALTTRELLVLRYFLQHVDRVVTRQQLLV